MGKQAEKERPVREHRPKPGRNAWICLHKDHEIKPRKFIREGEPKPTCNEHGNSMTPQANQPYRGERVPA